MDGTDETTSDSRKHKRLLERLDHMIQSGRVTEHEVERLRAAGDPREFDDAVLEVRLRHAGTSLDAAVQEGSLTHEEAEGFLGRLRNGEHPLPLRTQLRRLRLRARPRAGVSGLDRTEDDPQQDSPA